MGTLFRFRRKHVPEVVEPLPEPVMSIIDASSDKDNDAFSTYAGDGFASSASDALCSYARGRDRCLLS